MAMDQQSKFRHSRSLDNLFDQLQCPPSEVDLVEPTRTLNKQQKVLISYSCADLLGNMLLGKCMTCEELHLG